MKPPSFRALGRIGLRATAVVSLGWLVALSCDLAPGLWAGVTRPVPSDLSEPTPSQTRLLKTHLPALRWVVGASLGAGHPVPALASALTYFDAMRTSRGTANMIQGQRDFFGEHGFERKDRDGKDFHGPWAAER